MGGVEFYRSMWGPLGYDGDLTELAAVCADTVRRGYEGIEMNPFLLRQDAAAASRVVADHGLRFLARAHTFGANVEEHVRWVQRCVDLAVEFATPHVLVQSGADFFDDDQIDEFFVATAKIEATSGLRLAHETHRGCILNTPWVTARVLDRFPDTWLAADYSHWVVVAERYLETEGDILERCAPRTIHIDARVGTPESPQVGDPRRDDPSTTAAVAAFDGFWDEVHAAGALLTVVPEFGAAPYKPVDSGDLDEICEWTARRLRERWAA